MDRRVVELNIQNCPSVILDRILNSCYDYNDNQWNSIESGIRGAKYTEKLEACQHYVKEEVFQSYRQDNQEQKVHVRNVVKLEEQILRDETDRSVFRRSDLVPSVMFCWITLLVYHVRWQRPVEENSSWALSVTIRSRTIRSSFRWFCFF